MADLTKRSYQKELLDRDDIPFADIRRNMQELEIINSRLGGHAITLRGVKKLLNGQTHPFSICEIGCGGGDNLKAIYHWCKSKNIAVTVTGIDINPDCIRYATENCSALSLTSFITSPYEQVDMTANKPTIIFSSLFCHHLNDEQFIAMLQWCRRNAGQGFFINDLHRHSLAYYSISMLTRAFSKSYLVRHDAPLSVKRGFKKRELQALFEKAGISQYSIQWKWAFRWLIVVTC